MHGQPPHSLEKVSEQDSDEDSGVEAEPFNKNKGKIKEIGQFSKEFDQQQESRYM